MCGCERSVDTRHEREEERGRRRERDSRVVNRSTKWRGGKETRWVEKGMQETRQAIEQEKRQRESFAWREQKWVWRRAWQLRKIPCIVDQQWCALAGRIGYCYYRSIQYTHNVRLPGQTPSTSDFPSEPTRTIGSLYKPSHLAERQTSSDNAWTW